MVVIFKELLVIVAPIYNQMKIKLWYEIMTDLYNSLEFSHSCEGKNASGLACTHYNILLLLYS